MTDPSHYKNIIFDLGGVLLNLDFGRTEAAFRELGIQDLNRIYSHARQTGLFDDYETGRISSAQFRNEMRQFLRPGVSDQQIDRAWNAMLLDMPAERIALLKNVGQTHRIFLLSNTNEIHMQAYYAYMQQAHGFRDLAHVFIKQYLSFELGKRKPNADIFEHVIRENDLRKEETLFIDDSIQHIEGALKCGIAAIWLEKGKTVLDLFGKQR
jgi:putative hydrolase of the HAD superfamily